MRSSILGYISCMILMVVCISILASSSEALITGDAVFGTNKIYVSKTYNGTASVYYPQTIFAKANDSILFIPGAYKNIIIDGISTRIRFHGAVYTGNIRLVSFEIDGKRAYIPYSGNPVYVNSTFYPKRFKLVQVTSTGSSAVLQMLPEARDAAGAQIDQTGQPVQAIPAVQATQPVQVTQVQNSQPDVSGAKSATVQSNAVPQVYSMKAGQKRIVQVNGKNVTFEVVSINKNQNGEPDTAVFRIILQ